MKTPKRIACCSCGCWLNLESGDYMDDKGKFHNATALFCPKCGAAYPGEAFAARCTRKNREARLRHRIARLEEHILWMRQQAQEILEHVQNNVAPFLDSIDTYGHDIEGS